jgi:ribonuclease E
MSRKMLIDATHTEETRVVVVDGSRVEEFDFESVNKRQLAGNIYLAKVTRVEPSLQAAFVDYGGNRHGFLAFAEIHPDYYQIPIEDRKALMEEEERAARAEAQEEEAAARPARSRRRGKAAPAAAAAEGETVSEAAAESSEAGMEGEDQAGQADEGVEHLGEEAVAEELAPRRPRQRRYKIQEVIKVRQILLIQVVKEERGNKGAALTTYLSLAGRYCVLMPNTARGGGISRKITSASDRKKLKDIAGEIEVPRGAGLIIRTAGANRTKTEIRRDYEYLLRQWEEIRDLTLKSIAPAPIYEEGSLIKRSIRDLYSRDIEEVMVEGERGYREAKDYMKMLMPSHSKNVRLYDEPMPLFSRFQVESYLAAMFNPTVQLKSGGYIVIGVTEALVAIDVNSGRATRESTIEETATKTNLEAADEIARQLRLRDLAGLIVIDFIDMEDRRNNAAVEKRLKDRLKMDRARIQIGRISSFGLLEMSRQRLRPGMLEATTQPCPHCHGTGHTRSDDSLALSILRELEEEGVRKRSREVLVRVPVPIANYLLNHKREHIAMIEARFGLSVRVEADPHLISPEYTIEKFKTATRQVPEPAEGSVVRADSLAMAEEAEEDGPQEADDEAGEAAERPGQGDRPEGDGKRRRRRRRRRGGAGRHRDGQGGENQDAGSPDGGSEDGGAEAPAGDGGTGAAPTAAAGPATADAAGGRRSRSRRRPSGGHELAAIREAPSMAVVPAEPDSDDRPVAVPEDSRSAPRKRAARPKKSEPLAELGAALAMEKPAAVPVAPAAEDQAAEASPVAKKPRRRPAVIVQAETAGSPAPVAEAEPASEAPKKRGWWSRATGR